MMTWKLSIKENGFFIESKLYLGVGGKYAAIQAVIDIWGRFQK